MAGSSGSTLSEIHRSAQRLQLELSSDIEHLEQLETRISSSTSAYGGVGGGIGYGGAQWSAEPQIASPRTRSGSSQVQAELVEVMQGKLAQLTRMCTEMESLWRMHINRAERELWRRKVERLSEEAEAVRQALDKYVVRESRRNREAQERMELLQARNAGYDNNQIMSQVERDRKDLDSARRSNMMLEQTIAQGLATLANMAQHRDVLKGAQRRALDVLNYVGVSDSLLKKINRREYVDKIIAYGGMLVTLLVFFLIWWWLRSSGK